MDTLAKKYGADIAALTQIVLQSLLDTWMTTDMQYGDMFCFSCVVYLRVSTW